MFTRHQITLVSNPVCSRPVNNLIEADFQFYDKDGFELNIAEQKFYSAMGHPINYPILNHRCWQEPWFELDDDKTTDLILDHSMFLCRCAYDNAASNQLKSLRNKFPLADYLLRSKQKWGFDFALDAVAANGTVFEVLHIEYDNYNFEYFKNKMLIFERAIQHIDWRDAARRVWAHKDKWKSMRGFEQNNWKANYLINWNKAEYTEKTI